MKKRLEFAAGIVVIATFSMGQGQCPAITPPPFDATGVYTGTWSGMSDDMAQETEDCPLTFTLTQNIDAQGLGAFTIDGTVLIDNSCLNFPPEFELDEPRETPIRMLMATDGSGNIGTGSLNCGIGVCFTFLIGGQGVDTDSDGFMDAFSGNWAFTILLAGVQPFTVSGPFEVERVES